MNGFDNVDLFAAALDAEPGHQTFYLPPLTAHASFIARDVRGVEAIQIPTLTVDALVQAGAIPPPDVVKLDVEGAEMRLLSGAADTFAAHRPAMLFECDVNAERFGHTPGSFLRRLADLGYTRFFRMQGVMRTEVSPDDHPPFGDFLALDPERESLLERLPDGTR